MKSYILFDPETGQIISVAQAPEDQLPPKGPLNDGSGLSIRHGSADPAVDRVKWGRVVSKTKTVLRKQENDAAWAALRSERQRRLAASDWTQMPDTDLSEAQRLEWALYRQALRMLPQNTDDPTAPVWPVEPS